LAADRHVKERIMEYKTILVHVDDSPEAPDLVASAVRLAHAHGAHLVGMTQTGISRFIRETTLPGVELGDLTPLFHDLREVAEVRAASFDALARQAGLASFEHRIDDEEPGLALAVQALYADLVIVGRTRPGTPALSGIAGLPEYIAMNSPCPVLVVPHPGAHAHAYDRVMVAWNASPEAARAVRAALPLLARAKEVEVALFDDDSSSARSPEDATEVGRFLARHGVKASVTRHHPRGEVGNALLVLAEDRKVDLLVMGCYGHSRYREILLGGVSRTVLRRPAVPVLLAH
jgi:nucleotide-binding universal stress UspA family protein